MADGSGSSAILGVIVGVVIVVGVLFFAFGGADIFSGGGDTNISVDLPSTPAAKP